MTGVILKRASASRPFGEWNDDDFDVLADATGRRPHLQGSRRAGRNAVDVDAGLRATRRSHANARLRADARGPRAREEHAEACGQMGG